MSRVGSRREFLRAAGQITAGAALAPALTLAQSTPAAADSLKVAGTQQYVRGRNGYELQRLGAVWQALKPARYPDLIVQARSEADVVEVLRYARSRRTTVSVRGGGHNYIASYLRNGGILLDVSGLREVDVDTGAGLVRAQPGIRAAELCARLDRVIRQDTELPHQRALGVDDEEAGDREARLTDFLWRHLVALGSGAIDVDQSAVEDVEPDALWRLWLCGSLPGTELHVCQAREHDKRAEPGPYRPVRHRLSPEC